MVPFQKRILFALLVLLESVDLSADGVGFWCDTVKYNCHRHSSGIAEKNAASGPAPVRAPAAGKKPLESMIALLRMHLLLWPVMNLFRSYTCIRRKWRNSRSSWCHRCPRIRGMGPDQTPWDHRCSRIRRRTNFGTTFWRQTWFSCTSICCDCSWRRAFGISVLLSSPPAKSKRCVCGRSRWTRCDPIAYKEIDHRTLLLDIYRAVPWFRFVWCITGAIALAYVLLSKTWPIHRTLFAGLFDHSAWYFLDW